MSEVIELFLSILLDAIWAFWVHGGIYPTTASKPRPWIDRPNSPPLNRRERAAETHKRWLRE
ncbi:hypothetical protein BH09SUM1_BH09SUM1_07960 [soil metagenome]